jgi:predicted ribosome quality control (RQC) complex YloA/Tae2 family protein
VLPTFETQGGSFKGVIMAKNFMFEDIQVPEKTFRDLAGMSSGDLQELRSAFEYARGDADGMPMFGMLKACNEHRRRLKETLGVKGVSSSDDMKLEAELKHEKVQKERILNQLKLSMLIPKQEATDRVRGSLKAAANMIRGFCKSVSPLLLNLREARDAESIIVNHWNECVKELEKKSSIIEWEVDGSHTLLETRLNTIRKIDEDFGEVQ